jgi:hypothetical protein
MSEDDREDSTPGKWGSLCNVFFSLERLFPLGYGLFWTLTVFQEKFGKFNLRNAVPLLPAKTLR